LTCREIATGTHSVGDHVDPTDSLDASERRKISCLCWDSNHDYLVIQLININDNNCNIFITAGNK
jgi:hypothetical protein